MTHATKLALLDVGGSVVGFTAAACGVGAVQLAGTRTELSMILGTVWLVSTIVWLWIVRKVRS